MADINDFEGICKKGTGYLPCPVKNEEETKFVYPSEHQTACHKCKRFKKKGEAPSP